MPLKNNADLIPAIRDFIQIYNEAEKAYKGVQQIVLRIDSQIHNEFRYCARALTDFLDHTSNGNSENHDKTISLLSRADHAARNALNDSIDLLVAFAKVEIQRLASVDTGRPISSFYTDFGEVKSAIIKIVDKTEKTRQNRNSRLQEYVEISNSDEFTAIKKFCQYLPYLENEISNEYGRRISDNRRFWITVFLASISILIGLPSFHEWVDKKWSSEKLSSTDFPVSPTMYKQLIANK